MAIKKTEAMASTKNDRVYIRLNTDIKDDFEKVAVFRGLTTSAMLHSYIVRTVYETGWSILIYLGQIRMKSEITRMKSRRV